MIYARTPQGQQYTYFTCFLGRVRMRREKRYVPVHETGAEMQAYRELGGGGRSKAAVPTSLQG
jgi:hypothetical protein